MTEETIKLISDNQSFIFDHLKDDVHRLLFRYGQDEDKKILIGQIAARQKIRKKLPSWYDDPHLIFLPGLSLEQSSSEATALLKKRFITGSHLLDLTGGMGIDLHFLSDNFKQLTYCELNPELFEVSKHNLSSLHKHIDFHCGDGIQVLANSSADIVYADPYRRDDDNKKMHSFADCLPDLTAVLDQLVKSNRQSFVKASPMLDLQQGIDELKYVHHIYILSVKNECREIIYQLKNQGLKSPKITTYNISSSGLQHFEFQWPDRNFKAPLSEPLKYIFEPNASIMKSGGQDLLAQQFSIFKIHPNSNFFTSSEDIPDFPGRRFRVDRILKPFDKSLKKKRFNVISRNFPKKANEIEKKLQLKSAKVEFLLATQSISGDYLFISAKLIN